MKQLGSILALGIALGLAGCERAPETPLGRRGGRRSGADSGTGSRRPDQHHATGTCRRSRRTGAGTPGWLRSVDPGQHPG
jgi:hypothetical protein